MTRDSSVRQVNGQPDFLPWPPARKRTEKMLRDAFRCGRLIDLRPNGKGARNGQRATRRAVVPAEMIAAILGTDPGPGHARLELRGARITGPLDLSYARIEPAISLRDCVFDQPIVLAEARLGALALDGSEFPGIEAPNLEVNSDLGLSRVRSSRAVNLTGAQFHRDVRLRGAHLSHGEDQEVALAADHLVVDGSLTCDDGFEAAGTVTMAAARVNGAVRLDGARITADGQQKVAFYGDGMTVGHDFSAAGLSAEGEVRLIDVNIASTLELRGAKLTNGGGVALRLDRAEILSSLYCDNGFTATGDITAIGTHVKGSIYLNRAEIGRPRPAFRRGGAAADRRRAAAGAGEDRRRLRLLGELRRARHGRPLPADGSGRVHAGHHRPEGISHGRGPDQRQVCHARDQRRAAGLACSISPRRRPISSGMARRTGKGAPSSLMNSNTARSR